MADLSPKMQALAEAIRKHPKPVQTALLGFDLWIEALSSPHAAPKDVLKGGTIARGNEPDGVLKVPVMMLGGRIVISFDAALPPDGWLLRP